MVWAIEGDAVGEYESDVGDEFVCGGVLWCIGVRVGFRRIRAGEFALDGGEIHRVCDDGGVVGDVHRDPIDGVQERFCVF